MFKLAERVKETTGTTGTGTLTLGGAVTGFQTFLSGIGNGSTCTFTIYDPATGDWETSEGVLSGGTSLTRVTCIESSNSDALVNFTTIGSKTVALVHPGGRQGMLQLGATVSASASSSIDFTGIDGTYKWYAVRFKNVRLATDAASLLLRVSIASSFLSANYQTERLDINGNAATGTSGTAGSSFALTSDVDTGVAAHAINGQIDIFDPAGTTYHKMIRAEARWLRDTGGTYFLTRTLGAYIGGAGAIDGIRFLASSGNIASGDFTLFGGRA